MAACAAPWPTSRSTHSTQKHLHAGEGSAGEKVSQPLSVGPTRRPKKEKGAKGGRSCDEFDLKRFLSAPGWRTYISSLLRQPSELQCHPKPIKDPSASRSKAAAADWFHLFTGAALSLGGRAAGCTTQFGSSSIEHKKCHQLLGWGRGALIK